ncbi:MAG: pyridoxamine 5'-phosphate oxidase family protein [Chloroflexi bacterium]|nr:pyridoxamine 5'-phosphate oxidase family protein [Chloroflexota bacterium]
MDIKSGAEFANRNPVAFVATIEGDQPRVRAFMLLFANDNGFYFNTGARKDFYKQVEANPHMEICFFDPEKFEMLRVAGKFEVVEDMDLKKKIFDEREFLQKIVKSPDNPDFVVFRIAHGKGKLWRPVIETGEAPPETFEF